MIPAVNTFLTKLTIALWGYHLVPFLTNVTLLSFKLISYIGLANLTKMKLDFFLSKLPPVTDVPIVNFINTLEEIDSEYNKASPLWIIAVITVCSTVVARLVFLYVSWKCTKQYNEFVAWCTKRELRDYSTIEIVPTASNIKADINTLSPRRKRHQSLSLQEALIKNVLKYFDRCLDVLSPYCTPQTKHYTTLEDP